MKNFKIISLLVLVIVSLFVPAAAQRSENHNWGFCIATAVVNGRQYEFVSQVIDFSIDDAQYGFPNTKVIRRWKLVVADYCREMNFASFTWSYDLLTRFCSADKYYESDLEAEEGRSCWLKKHTGAYKVTFDY